MRVGRLRGPRGRSHVGAGFGLAGEHRCPRQLPFEVANWVSSLFGTYDIYKLLGYPHERLYPIR